MCSDLDSDPCLKGQCYTRHLTVRVHNALVCSITYICIFGLPSNLVQMLSLLRRCAYIQEYLGYLSNNLYFLFSHSWPVVVYNFGQVQRTSRVERKTKYSKKTMAGDIAVLWTALFMFDNVINIIYCKSESWSMFKLFFQHREKLGKKMEKCQHKKETMIALGKVRICIKVLLNVLTTKYPPIVLQFNITSFDQLQFIVT